MGATFRVDPMGVVEDNFWGPTSTTGERLYDGDTAVGPANDETEVIDASDAGTQRRQAWSQDREQPEFSEQPDHHPDRHEWRAVAIAAAAVLVICSSLVFVIVWHSNNGPAPGPTITVLPPTAAQLPPPVVAAPKTVTQTVLPPTALPTQRPVPTPASQQLQQYADEDPPYTAYVAAGQWVPQLSSKHGAQPWTYDKEDGVTYDSELTLQEHQRLRQQYGAKLIWSGDWVTPAGNTVWDHPDYWITVAPIVFPDSGGALKWCTSHGLDSDHCDAQNLITGHAAYN
jgi:serine/threonine kinase PknH